MTKLTWEGAAERYPSGVPAKIATQLEYELELIADLHYESYFLTVWDLVRFARSRNILCQGRGSAANSAVCFCLGVTSVDPATSDLLFERFISRERNEAPDIDIDFEHERREEVLQYVYEKYGRERAGLGGHRHYLLQPVGDSRRGQGARLVARSGRYAGEARRRLYARAEACRALPRSGHRSDIRSGTAARLLRERDHRLSAAFVATRGRHGDDRGAAVRDGADRKCRDGRPHRNRVGQGRPGRARHFEGRLFVPRHAHGDSQVLRSGARAFGRRSQAN